MSTVIHASNSRHADRVEPSDLGRVGLVSYPTLFQAAGGLAMRVKRTAIELGRQGVHAEIVDLVHQNLRDFDLVHVFGAFNGNHQLVAQASSVGCSVVLSPVLMPPYRLLDEHVAHTIDRVAGRVTRWAVQTRHGQTRSALNRAGHLVALGAAERRFLIRAFAQSEERITVIPNAVGDEFFDASPERFQEKFAPERPFVLHVGIIGELKNQLGLVRALIGTEFDVYLVGTCSGDSNSYLNACLSEGRGRVRYLGEFRAGDPLLVSAYAAAHVVAVPSLYEGMSNCVLEALAAGTPVVTTRNHSWDYPKNQRAVIEVDPKDIRQIKSATLALAQSRKDTDACRSVVSRLRWTDHVAQLLETYHRTKTLCAAAKQSLL